MKKLVISLLRRPDRKVSFQTNNLTNFQYIEAIDGSAKTFRHIEARKYWIDPFKKRPLQQNEVGCFLSHIKAWNKCIEIGEPVIVMEDDVIINNHYDEDYYESLDYDFVYLQRNENEPELVVSIDDRLEKPAYPYNMTAYKITPNGARKLIEALD